MSFRGDPGVPAAELAAARRGPHPNTRNEAPIQTDPNPSSSEIPSLVRFPEPRVGRIRSSPLRRLSAAPGKRKDPGMFRHLRTPKSVAGQELNERPGPDLLRRNFGNREV